MLMFMTTSYDDVAARLQAAVDWLESLGIAHEPTRLGEYRRAIDALTQAKDRSTILRQQLPAINNAIYEAFELIDVHGALAGKYDDDIVRHLKQVAGGPATYSDENPASSSNRARNIAFELAVMAYLAKAGLLLYFTTAADVTCVFENRTLLFECKRPQSLDVVDRRVKDGLEQLKKRINTLQKATRRGLVALELTKAINPKFEVFVTQSEDEIGRSMTEQVDRFIARYKPSWENPRCNQTIGVLVRLRQMNIVEYDGYSKLFHGLQVGITPIDSIGELNHRLLESLVTQLSGTRSAV